jgi:hypothetical protein
MSRSSRARLTSRAIPRFPSESLFDRVARVVCAAECLPRKELYESWEVARRVRRHYRGGRVVDLAGGHGLVAHLCILLDDSSASAVIVDRRIPKSAGLLSAALTAVWPRLAGRVAFVEDDVASVVIEREDLVLSVHACGSLTDLVLRKAVTSTARVAVLPCCHDLRANDTGGLTGWVDGSLAIDLTRAAYLRAEGYAVRTQALPPDITEKSRLLLGEPTSPVTRGSP